MNFFPSQERARAQTVQSFKTSLSKYVPKVCTFSLNSQMEVIVHSLDAFSSPQETELLQKLKSFKCPRIDATKFLIKSQDLYRNLTQSIDCSFANLIPNFVFQALQPIGFSLKIHAQLSIKYFPSDSARQVSSLPPSFLDHLYQFQKQGIEFGIRNNGRVLIADEMGVGKTIQGLGLAYLYKESWPLLVICPSLLMLNWKDEALKWITELKPIHIQVIQKQKEKIDPQKKIYITSYDLSIHHVDKFKEIDIKIGIVDEAHHLKSALSKRSQTLVPYLKGFKHIIMLTGTPALAKPKELFNILSIVRPDVFQLFKGFGFRYCDPKKSRFTEGYDYDGCSNAGELHTILTKSIMIRRLKKEVLDQLPSKVRLNIKIKVEPVIEKEITAILKQNEGKIEQALRGGVNNYQYQPQEKEIIEIDSDSGQQKTNNRSGTLVLVQKCYQLTGQAKLKGVIEYLEEILDDSSEQKFIIFAHHLLVLDGIQNFLDQKKIKFIRLDGSVSVKDRHESVQQFQSILTIKVALLSLTAASIGITLTAASTVIFTELHWTPGILKQAEDRAHRIGQKDCVTCVYLLGPKTLDDKIMNIIDLKQDTLDKILNGQQQVTEYAAVVNEDLQEKKQSISLVQKQLKDQTKPKVDLQDVLEFIKECEEQDQKDSSFDTDQLFQHIEELLASKRKSTSKEIKIEEENRENLISEFEKQLNDHQFY